MNRFIKGAGILVGGLLLVAVGGYAYVELTYNVSYPDTPLPAITASQDPAVIARGKYVVDHVAHCSTCHGEVQDPASHDVDITRPLSGGHTWHIGPFGTFVAANLTADKQAGLGAWSDAEIARAVRHSVGRDGTLLSFMRIAVGPMGDEDLTAVVSYLRSLAPVPAARPRDELGFLAKALSSKFTPRTATIDYAAPASAPSEARGKYLAEGPAMCVGCHTPADPGEGFALIGPHFSGAAEADPDHTEDGFEIIAPNLTSHPQAGVTGKWSEDEFVERFRRGRQFQGSKMPWEAFQGMEENDLRSVYRYLRSVPAVERDVGPTRRPVGSYAG